MISDWTVIVARDDAPDDDFSRALLEQRVGVAPLRLMRTQRIDAAIDGEFDVVAYCSRAAADAVGGEAFGAKVVAAVGDATAQRLRDHGLAVDVVGSGGGAELGAALVAKGVKGKRVLLPRAEGGNDDLKNALEGAGAVVVCVDVYRSVAVDVDEASVEEVAAPRALFLTSPKRVAELVKKVRVPADVVVIAIGDTTAKAITEAGQRVDAILKTPTPEALLDALETQENPR